MYAKTFVLTGNVFSENIFYMIYLIFLYQSLITLEQEWFIYASTTSLVAWTNNLRANWGTRCAVIMHRKVTSAVSHCPPIRCSGKDELMTGCVVFSQWVGELKRTSIMGTDDRGQITGASHYWRQQYQKTNERVSLATVSLTLKWSEKFTKYTTVEKFGMVRLSFAHQATFI